jgi:nitric oxide reductase subunit B
MRYTRLWVGLAFVLVASFAVLGFFGRDITRQAPPVPERVVTSDGTVVWTGQDIRDGQNVWQSLGGQEVGSIWGHGAYVAPDWSADWLHQEATWLLDHWAVEADGVPYAQLDEARQASLRVRLKQELRTNTYHPTTGDLTTLSRARPWVAAYRWPIYFFVAVAFWNLVGAGLFGFFINPPDCPVLHARPQYHASA